jgi:hypothetical protein
MLLNMHGECWLGESARLGSPAEMAVNDEGLDIAQLPVRQSYHRVRLSL